MLNASHALWGNEAGILVFLYATNLLEIMADGVSHKKYGTC
jgi:hypothetical protein